MLVVIIITLVAVVLFYPWSSIPLSSAAVKEHVES